MIYHSADCLRHTPKFEFDGHSMRTYPEQADRVSRIVMALQAAEITTKHPEHFQRSWITRVHSDDYVNFIESIPDDLEDTAPTAYMYGGRLTTESSFYAKLGRYFFDPATPIMGGTASAAFAAVDTVLSMAEQLSSSYDKVSAALSRPPGHHAMVDCGGGYCIFNNAAIAAEFLRAKGKSVSILDLDYHHGNGTQSIFYERDDVQYVSIHADPQNNYPFYWGFPEQTGTGLGDGYTHNLAVANTISEEKYLNHIDKAVRLVKEYGADVVLLSMGFDGHVDDPIAGLSLTTESYTKIGQKLRDFDKVGIILEGGYALHEIGPAFVNLYTNLLG